MNSLLVLLIINALLVMHDQNKTMCYSKDTLLNIGSYSRTGLNKTTQSLISDLGIHKRPFKTHRGRRKSAVFNGYEINQSNMDIQVIMSEKKGDAKTKKSYQF